MEPKDRQSQDLSPAVKGDRGMWPAALGPWSGLRDGHLQDCNNQGHPISRVMIQSALGWVHCCTWGTLAPLFSNLIQHLNNQNYI